MYELTKPITICSCNVDAKKKEKREKAACNVGHLNSRKDLKGQPVSALEAAFQTGPQDKTRAFFFKTSFR